MYNVHVYTFIYININERRISVTRERTTRILKNASCFINSVCLLCILCFCLWALTLFCFISLQLYSAFPFSYSSLSLSLSLILSLAPGFMWRHHQIWSTQTQLPRSDLPTDNCVAFPQMAMTDERPATIDPCRFPLFYTHPKQNNDYLNFYCIYSYWHFYR